MLISKLSYAFGNHAAGAVQLSSMYGCVLRRRSLNYSLLFCSQRRAAAGPASLAKRCTKLVGSSKCGPTGI